MNISSNSHSNKETPNQLSLTTASTIITTEQGRKTQGLFVSCTCIARNSKSFYFYERPENGKEKLNIKKKQPLNNFPFNAN